MRVYYLKCQPSTRGNYWLIRLNVILLAFQLAQRNRFWEESSYARLDSKLLRVCDQYLREAFCFSEKGNGKKLSWQYIYVYIYLSNNKGQNISYDDRRDRRSLTLSAPPLRRWRPPSKNSDIWLSIAVLNQAVLLKCVPNTR